ncbi:putative glycosyltransferase [Geobacter sp. OR-1]|uniref:glycosyltransferase family A protein n=1 Tax=Geobacter sp. OR-1 TaxID=1266765 RepID=UPI000541D48D|nr:glycosyltransferase family A protein [Geobacter sp. OR-1]GAM11024.1 putative glycosyltransferase [Geobacter sp. OR-1]
MPKVTVVIPCFNQGAYVDEAVDSVLNQTLQDIEIIIVNDGSTDKSTNALLDAYSKPNTKVISIKNQGPGVARNIGISAAAGEYIFPLDADDKIAPTSLEKAVVILDEKPEVGIVCSLVDFFGAKRGRFVVSDFSERDLLLANHICASAMFRKSDWEHTGGYNVNMKFGWEDWDFWLSLIELGRSVHRIPEVLFYYRVKNSSRTTNLTDEKQQAMYRQLFENHRQLYSENIDHLFAAVEKYRSSWEYHLKTRLRYYFRYLKSWI